MSVVRSTQILNAFLITVMISQLGHEALSSSFTIVMVRLAITMVFMSPLFSIAPITSNFVKYQAIFESGFDGFVKQSWIASMILSIIPVLFLYRLSDVLHALNQPSDLIPIICGYFLLFKWSVPAIYMTSSNYQIISGMRKKKLVISLSVLSLLLSVFTNFVLIFGLS